MKNKFSLLVSGAAIALAACSSLEVSNPETGNYPAGWNVAEFLEVNPDLRSLAIMDQVANLNAESGAASDEAEFRKDTATYTAVAINFAGFTAENFTGSSDQMKHLIKFNIYGISNEEEVLGTFTLDTAAIEKQYVAYGRREGRPVRTCMDSDNVFLKGDCQAVMDTIYAKCTEDDVATGVPGCDKVGKKYIDDIVNTGRFDNHIFCRKGSDVYCLDCTEACAKPVEPTVPEEEKTPEGTDEKAPVEEETPAETPDETPAETPAETPDETPAETETPADA